MSHFPPAPPRLVKFSSGASCLSEEEEKEKKTLETKEAVYSLSHSSGIRKEEKA